MFSSNGHPFEENKAYKPYAIYTYLKYGTSKEDFKKSAKDLKKMGFGKTQDQSVANLNDALFSIRNDDNDYGYSYESEDGRTSCDLTNFTIDFSNRIVYEKGGRHQSYFTGYVQFAQGEIVSFERLDTEDFVDPRKFEIFLTNLCGTRIMFYDPSTQKKRLVVEAVKYFNQSVAITEAVEFGYDKDVKSYVTGEIKIDKESITEMIVPIKYTEAPNLGLSVVSPDELKDIREEYIEKFLD